MIVSSLRQDVGGLAAIASLAVTCRAFYEIASDELWADQWGLAELMQCFSGGIAAPSDSGMAVSALSRPSGSTNFGLRVGFHASAVTP